MLIFKGTQEDIFKVAVTAINASMPIFDVSQYENREYIVEDARLLLKTMVSKEYLDIVTFRSREVNIKITENRVFDNYKYWSIELTKEEAYCTFLQTYNTLEELVKASNCTIISKGDNNQ